jgi:ribose 5-phosphate isomerase A
MTPDQLKEVAAIKAVEYVRDGMVVGLGTGSTAEHAIKALGERAGTGLQIQCIPTSDASASLATQVGLDLVDIEDEPVIDLTIDGADEVNPSLDVLKGMGGALLREKIVAAASTLEIIIVDESKLVDILGSKNPLPVEVVPFARAFAQRRLSGIARQAEIRRTPSGEEFTTDNGNLIIDCHFELGIDDAAAIEIAVNQIPGVVDNGLFIQLTHLVIVGQHDGSCRLIESPEKM